MQLGTAKISHAETAQGYRYVILQYLNVGSFLKGERTFLNSDEAREFCAARGLRVVR